jgi:hypothetical protein
MLVSGPFTQLCASSVKSTLAANEERYEVYMRRDPSTHVVVEEWWTEDSGGLGGRFHRVGAPATISRDPVSGVAVEEHWYFHGKLHREDGPAVVRRSSEGKVKYTSWFRHGELVPYRKRGGPALCDAPPVPGS